MPLTFVNDGLMRSGFDACIKFTQLANHVPQCRRPLFHRGREVRSPKVKRTLQEPANIFLRIRALIRKADNVEQLPKPTSERPGLRWHRITISHQLRAC